jgi:hypothetical protein
VFERAGFAGRHRSDQRVDLGFWQIGELFEQGGGHLFALRFFPRPDPVDLVDQPLPRIVNEKRFAVLVGLLGTECSNPSSSTGESANPRSLFEANGRPRTCATAAGPCYLHAEPRMGAVAKGPA